MTQLCQTLGPGCVAKVSVGRQVLPPPPPLPTFTAVGRPRKPRHLQTSHMGRAADGGGKSRHHSSSVYHTSTYFQNSNSVIVTHTRAHMHTYNSHHYTHKMLIPIPVSLSPSLTHTTPTALTSPDTPLSHDDATVRFIFLGEPHRPYFLTEIKHSDSHSLPLIHTRAH